METLQTLGVALGLASLAGLNLYLTVFVTGLAIHQNWINISQTHPDLAILGHPAIIAVAGTLYFLQFFADKVPWVDSLWDAVHTIIRPIGGAFLAIKVLGTPDPVFDVIAALLAGSAALLTHGLKSGVRLVANTSPEPFSNIALSLTEDATVLGGLALIKYDPTLAFVLFLIVSLTIAYLAPKIFRALKAHAYLMVKKIFSPASDEMESDLSKALPPDLEIAFRGATPKGRDILWTASCISASARKIPGNVFGYLVATADDAQTLAFVAKRGWKHVSEQIDLATYKVAHESKFLSENIVFYSREEAEIRIHIPPGPARDGQSSGCINAGTAQLAENGGASSRSRRGHRLTYPGAPCPPCRQ